MSNLSNNKPLTDEFGEVRELSKEDFTKGKSINDFPQLQALAKQVGRPKATVTKVSTTLRFDASTLAYFKEQGKGWQTRMNEVLTEYVKAHS